MRADRRLLLLGDWHWLVRDPLDVLRLAFFAGTAVFAAMGRSTAVGLTAACLIVLVARVVNLPRRFDFGLIVGATLLAWGTALNLYGRYEFYDTIVHGVTPLFYVPVLYLCLARLGVVTDPGEETTRAQHAGVFLSSLAIGMAVAAGYEVAEWLSDSLAGTSYVEDADDTGRDLLANTIGSLVAAGLLVGWTVSGWTSHRRTYRAAPLPDLRQWAALGRALVRLGRGRVERAGTGGWLALAASGAVTLVFGVLVVAWPRLATDTLVVLFGVSAVAAGALRLVAELVRARSVLRIPLALDALAAVGAGVVVLVWPRISLAALFYVIAAAMAFAGFVGIAFASAIARLTVRERALVAAVGAASVALAIVMLAWPDATVGAVRWVIAAQALLAGPLLVAAGLRVRRGSPLSRRGRGEAGRRPVEPEAPSPARGGRPAPPPD